MQRQTSLYTYYRLASQQFSVCGPHYALLQETRNKIGLMHFGGSLYRNAWEALVLNSTWYDAYDPWSIFFCFQAGLRYRPLIGEHVNFHIFHMIFCRYVSELGWNHHLIVPVVNCNMCESESLKIGIPWHHCDPLEGSHFQLVFGKSLSSVVWWLVLPQFQLHQPLTSCIGQLGCHLGGFFGGTGYPASTLRTSTQLMQGVFGGTCGRLEDWTEPFHIISLIVFQVSDIYQFNPKYISYIKV